MKSLNIITTHAHALLLLAAVESVLSMNTVPGWSRRQVQAPLFAAMCSQNGPGLSSGGIAR